MKSLRELFRIGKGPSSSHTMGPNNAALIYAKRHPEAKSFEVTGQPIFPVHASKLDKERVSRFSRCMRLN